MKTIYLQRQGSSNSYNTNNCINSQLGFYIGVQPITNDKYHVSIVSRIGRNFLNPLYKDSKASCNVYFNRKTGTYYMKDFGNPSYSGDCFFLVASLKGLDSNNASDFVTVLQAINREMNLNISTDTASKGTSNTERATRSRSGKEVIQAPSLQFYPTAHDRSRIAVLGQIGD